MRTDSLHHAVGEGNRAVLSEFVAEKLSESDRAVVMAHLQTCGECRGVLTLITPEEGPPSPLVLGAKRLK